MLLLDKPVFFATIKEKGVKLMLLTIKQVKASGENLFQVTSAQGLLFEAKTPWLALQAPFHAENLRQLTFTDPDGKPVYHTEYNLMQNSIEDFTATKSLLGKESHQMQYEVVDSEGCCHGSFFHQTNSAFDAHYTVLYHGEPLLCYTRSIGKVFAVSIFCRQRQVGQITKSLDVKNNLDVYYLHLEDTRQELVPVLSFFTVYLDSREFHRGGQAVKASGEVSWSYTYDKNNDRYDPHWIADTFGTPAAQELNRLLGGTEERNLLDPATCSKAKVLIPLCVVGGFVVVGLWFWLLLHYLQ